MKNVENGPIADHSQPREEANLILDEIISRIVEQERDTLVKEILDQMVETAMAQSNQRYQVDDIIDMIEDLRDEVPINFPN